MRTSLRGNSGFSVLQSFLPFFAFSVSWPLVPRGWLILGVADFLAQQIITAHSRPRPGDLESGGQQRICLPCFLYLLAPDPGEIKSQPLSRVTFLGGALTAVLSLRVSLQSAAPGPVQNALPVLRDAWGWALSGHVHR